MQPAGADTLRGKAILVVEDDPDGRELVKVILADQGAEVRAACGAEEALALFERHRFHALVSDIAMPGVDGCSLLARIRHREEELGRAVTPAVALTAFGGTADVLRAGSAGFQRFIPKPFDPSQLLRALRELTRGQLA